MVDKSRAFWPPPLEKIRMTLPSSKHRRPNMPNKPRRNKNDRRGSRRRVAQNRPGADSVKKPDSVKSLLARSGPVLGRIADQAARHDVWREWLTERIGAPLRARITGIVEREGALVIFTESAGWGVRLRYAMAELEPELRRAYPQVARVIVRVLPAGESP